MCDNDKQIMIETLEDFGVSFVFKWVLLTRQAYGIAFDFFFFFFWRLGGIVTVIYGSLRIES